MDQNKQKCIECMEKIKKRLDNLGFATIMTTNRENILCKYSSSDSINMNNETNNSNNNNANAVAVINSCPVARSSAKCPYPKCIYPSATCHLHSTDKEDNNDSNNSSNDTNTNFVGLGETIDKYAGSLFRIMPNDIHTGLLLHAIKLHGETCELKMSFDYDDNGVLEIVNIIRFLVK